MTMHVFKLTPNNPKWPTHIFKKLDFILVRASSEAKARDLVKSVTFISQKSNIRGQVNNPWQNRSFSKCEIYQGAEFSKEGKEEVLLPEILRDRFNELNAK